MTVIHLLVVRAIRPLVLCVLSLCISPLGRCQGVGEIFVPAGGGDMQNYFAGTNCKVSGGGSGFGPIAHSMLILESGGIQTVVKEFISDGEWYPFSSSLAAVFDSSHYAPGSSVTVKFKIFVAGNPTPYMAVGGPVTVINKHMAFEIPDPSFTPDAAPVANSFMTGKNYTLSMNNGGAWSGATYFADMDGTNAVMVYAHGLFGSHTSGDDYNLRPQWINPLYMDLAYQYNREQQVGVPTWPLYLDAPPFNSGAPPLNFIHLVCCLCGQNPAWKMGCLYPGVWRDGVEFENQAVFAYTVLTRAIEGAAHATEVWREMANGETAGTARNRIVTGLLNGSLQLYCWDSWEAYENGQEKRLMASPDFAIHGDETARVKTVYTGLNGPPAGWYR